MVTQFLFGFAVSILNIVVHALIMTLVIRAAQKAGKSRTSQPAAPLIGIMAATVSVLMAAHTSEVIVWSLAYGLVDAAPASANLIYFAFVNYTTLGYGDITHVERWQILGPMTAMNGVLLFGWSTAVIFEVLRRALVRLDLVQGAERLPEP